MKKKIHGLSYHPLYKATVSQMDRCNNPLAKDFKRYGAKGIKFKFKSLAEAIAFYETLGPPPTPQHTLDREDPNGHYEFGKVRWANKSEQALNQRLHKDKTSSFRGVNWNEQSKVWRAHIFIDKKQVYLGPFQSEIEAASAYLEKYFELHKKWPPEYSKTPLCYKTPLHHLGLL